MRRERQGNGMGGRETKGRMYLTVRDDRGEAGDMQIQNIVNEDSSK